MELFRFVSISHFCVYFSVAVMRRQIFKMQKHGFNMKKHTHISFIELTLSCFQFYFDNKGCAGSDCQYKNV